LAGLRPGLRRIKASSRLVHGSFRIKRNRSQSSFSARPQVRSAAAIEGNDIEARLTLGKFGALAQESSRDVHHARLLADNGGYSAALPYALLARLRTSTKTMAPRSDVPDKVHRHGSANCVRSGAGRRIPDAAAPALRPRLRA